MSKDAYLYEQAMEALVVQMKNRAAKKVPRGSEAALECDSCALLVEQALDLIRNRSKQPHAMATPALFPCTKCGYDWVRPVIDLSDESANEIPMFIGCARCKTKAKEFPVLING